MFIVYYSRRGFPQGQYSRFQDQHMRMASLHLSWMIRPRGQRADIRRPQRNAAAPYFKQPNHSTQLFEVNTQHALLRRCHHRCCLRCPCDGQFRNNHPSFWFVSSPPNPTYSLPFPLFFFYFTNRSARRRCGQGLPQILFERIP